MESVEQGSGNVFADIGLPDPEEHLAKVKVSLLIEDLIKERGLTQGQAAGVMGTSQAELSQIIRGVLRDFTMDRLFRCLNALDQDVEISVHPKREARGRVLVAVP